MADDKVKDPDPEPEPEKGFTSTASGVETNEVVTQTPDQFFDPSREQAARDVPPPKNHATKGMTSLGWTEASRLENTAEQQERDRKAAEKLAAKED